MLHLRNSLFILQACISARLSAQCDSTRSVQIGKYETHYTFFDRSTGKPCTDLAEGPSVACVITKVDENGNQIEMSFLDTLGKHVCDSDSIAYYISKYDAHGRLLENRYYSLSYRDVLPADYALYDAKGLETESGHIRCNDTVRINFTRTTYDSKDRVRAETNYYTWDTLGYTDENYCSKRYYYDDHNRFTGYSYHDTNGKLMYVDLTSERLAFVRYEYDKKGRLMRFGWYDADSLPVNQSSYRTNYSTVVLSYKKNRVSEVNLYNSSHEPASGLVGYDVQNYPFCRYSSDNYEPFSRKVYQYNCFGEVVAEVYYDQYDRQVAATSYHYFLGIFRSGHGPQ